MKRFSIGRVVSYLRYVYTVYAKNYIWNVLTMFALPLIMAFLDRSILAASEMSMFVYVVASMVLPVREVMPLRDRGYKLLAMTQPVSNEERWLAMVFNMAILLPAVAMVTSVLSIVVAAPFSYYDVALGEFIVDHLDEQFLQWPIYVLIQIIASVSLLIAIMARRSLMLAYVVVFVGLFLFMYLIADLSVSHEWYLTIEANIDTVELVGKIVYCSIPLIFYVLCYVALRLRQVKW